MAIITLLLRYLAVINRPVFTPHHMSHVRHQVSGVRCHVSSVTCQVSRVRCHMSRVMCHVSHVRCHMYLFFFFFFFGQSGGAIRWRVCYQRGLPCLVFQTVGIIAERRYVDFFGYTPLL